MHKSNTVHGDIKPANCLLFEVADGRHHVTAKLSDLGFSINLDFHEEAQYRGTPLYLAPELKMQSQADRKSINYKACDVYSFGLLVWAIFNRGHFALMDGESYPTEDSSQEAKMDFHEPQRLWNSALEFASTQAESADADVLTKVLSACLQETVSMRYCIEDVY